MSGSSQQDINRILRLMNEDMNVPGSTQNLSGAKYAQEAEMNELGTNILPGFNTEMNSTEDLTVGETFSDREVKIGKRFIELLGGHNRARDLLDKIIQSDQIFGITDDQQDAAQIGQIADDTPDHPDFASDFTPNFSARFDPSSY